MSQLNGSENTEPEYEFATRAIHAGQDSKQWNCLAVVPPIFMTTTFGQFAPGKHTGYEYGRSGNPTRDCLEACIASLENAKHGLCFSSGLTATLTLTHILEAGDHVISSDDVYGGTNRYFRTCASKFGIQTSFVDARDPNNVEKAIKENTKLIWLETPTNPTMKLIDIKAVTTLVKKKSNAIVVVDNTFMTPYFQLPLKLGADVVMHSVTKYMNGHTDVIMGAIALNNSALYEKLKYLQYSLGGVPSPMDCFLVNRGLKTLSLRMEKHGKNATEVVEYLDKHPQVEKVLYPGLPSHPQHELAKRQCSGFSGMVSFYIKANREGTEEFIKNLKVFTLAESLGGYESLIEVPSIMTHASVPEDQRTILGITDNLIRVSVGLEDSRDLIKDLDQAFKKLLKK